MKSTLGLFFLLFTFFVRAQGDEIWIYPNKGQWDAKINYKIDLQAGKMYLENNRFTYHFYESPQKHPHTNKRKSVDKNTTIHNHVVQQTFIGANPSAHSSIDNSLHYTNYFIGKDTSTWRSNVHATQEITYYVPYTFTPNSSNGNDLFKAVGENITNFQLDIFNRWGENIISFTDIEDTWDGTFNGKPCKDGTYSWKIRYIDSFGNEHFKLGHVNLIR